MRYNWTKSSSPLTAGVSLVELLIALTVLATASVGIFQLMSRSELQLYQARNELTTQQVEEAIGSYIYDDFLENSLTDNSSTIEFDGSALPDDLQNDNLSIATIFGTQARYANSETRAKCRLTSATDETIGSISFDSDCVVTPETSLDNSSIAQNINAVLEVGARISFAVENAGGRCTASQPMDNTTIGYNQTSTLIVDDPNCLSNPASGQPEANSEIIFPRFVAYSTAQPSRYYTSFVENSVQESRGMKLSVPDNVTVKSGLAKTVPNLVLTALSDNDSGVITASTGVEGAFLRITNASGATVTGDNTSTITLTGTFDELKKAIRTLTYRSAVSYFGDDEITIGARSGPLAINDSLDVIVTPNCGDLTQGTATRFDLGYIDNSSGMSVFDNSTQTFYTSVSVFDDEAPTYYYGFCKNNNERFDFATETRLTGSAADCSVSPYKHASTRLQAEAVSRAITTILYEENDQNGADRYALVFVFDRVSGTCNAGTPSGSTNAERLVSARSTGYGLTNNQAATFGWQGNSGTDNRCHLIFRLSNIEPGRDLNDKNDLHTFSDDPNEYSGGNGSIVDSSGVITANSGWQGPTDGVVVPLRIDNTSNTPRELSQYAYGNPIFELLWWDTVNKWNIRSVIPSTNTVGFQQVNFTPGNANQNMAIRLNIDQSQRCPTS